MTLTRVLIAVKTYPTLSTKYDELVCTAGFREDGQWIRIFPIQFRRLDYPSQYKKYEWVEIDLVKNEKDFRAESYRPRTAESYPQMVGKLGTEKNWAARKDIALGNVRTDLSQLITEAKEHTTSLAVFKPRKVTGFHYKACEREWPKDKLLLLNQQKIFQPFGDERFEIVRKLPYTFHYSFEDQAGRSSKLMIEDWEIGALYWNCLIRTGGDEKAACEQVKKKYYDEFVEKTDLHFFLGTRYVEHVKNYDNPYSIIGVFYPPKEKPKLQLGLFQSCHFAHSLLR